MTRLKVSFVLMAVVAIGLSLATGCGGGASAPGTPDTVVFVGASITEAWDFDRFFPGRDFRKVIHFDADKTAVWNEVARQQPGIVVVKECAAYFYADGGTPIDEYMAYVDEMAGLIRSIGAVPVIATTIPVDVGQGDCTATQLADIQVFNERVREYCAGQGIVCMDYDAAIADSEGQLPASCHDGDGLHPNDTGYTILSGIVVPVLELAGL